MSCNRYVVHSIYTPQLRILLISLSSDSLTSDQPFVDQCGKSPVSETCCWLGAITEPFTLPAACRAISLSGLAECIRSPAFQYPVTSLAVLPLAALCLLLLAAFLLPSSCLLPAFFLPLWPPGVSLTKKIGFYEGYAGGQWLQYCQNRRKPGVENQVPLLTDVFRLTRFFWLDRGVATDR